MTTIKTKSKGSVTVTKLVRNSSVSTPRPAFARRHALSLISFSSLAFALPLTGNAEGFVDDAKATLNLRNAYFNRNFTNPANAQAKAEEWTESFILVAKSGFTPGPVGFGVDVLGMYSQKLDGGQGTGGTQLLPIHDDGRPADNFGRLGVALKGKISKTEVK